MGRAPCCEKVGLRRGRWTAEEDQILSNYIRVHGEGSWRSLPKNAGLLRCGKSCRLRWINYLRSNIKRGNISAEEEDTIVKLHASFGNRWSLIAAHLDGRTDNEIKNYWNSHLSRKIIPSTSAIPTKRRISTIKIKKPRKKPSTPSSEIQSNMNPSITTGDEVMHESFTSGGGEKESELGDCFYNESLLMDPTEMLVLTDEDDHVINNMNSSSSSSNDGSQVNQVVNLGCEWGFDGGDEEDDIMKSWPWENPMEELRVDVKKQDAMIAWLLS